VGRRADLKTGYDCNSNCVFCVIGDKLFTGNRSTEECIEELRESRKTCDDVVFTGAEATIRKDFFHLVKVARTLGYQNIQIQTNGRMFAYREFCERAIAAGANEFGPSIHGHTARLHDGLTRSKGSFDQITAAIRNLKALGQRVVSNTVITRQNAKHLPAMARMLVDLGVDQFQLAFPHPTGHAETYFRGVVPDMAAVAPYVHEALQIGIDSGTDCMAEAIPYCHMQGYEPYVAELHIPPTEIVYDGFVVPDYKRDRIERGKTRFPQCASCRWEPICEGPWREYPAIRGDDEFQPVAGPRVIDEAIVFDDRFPLLGSSAPPVPGIELADIETPWVALVFYPEDGSPGCTAQACSIQSDLAGLTDAGITVLGISPDDAESHARFAAANHLGYRLLSDPDGACAAAYGARPPRGQGVRRSTYLIGPERRIDHILVAPNVRQHGAEIADAVRRYAAPPRPLERGEELVVIRRRARPMPQVAEELGLSAEDPSNFVD
jgi:cyclic pyranopterin phosphate synthase